MILRLLRFARCRGWEESFYRPLWVPLRDIQMVAISEDSLCRFSFVHQREKRHDDLRMAPNSVGVLFRTHFGFFDS